MQQSQEIPEQRLITATVSRAQAEHVEWAEMLHYSERLVTEYSAIEEYFARQATLLSIPLEIGVAMNMSEDQVRRVLSAAERLREQTPAVWSAFGDGVIDARRAHLISDAVGRLQRDTSIAKLNLKPSATPPTTPASSSRPGSRSSSPGSRPTCSTSAPNTNAPNAASTSPTAMTR